MTKEEIIEMSRYAASEEIHEKCEGCDKVFDWHGTEGTIIVQKCRAYIRPSKWWEEKPVAIAPTLVYSRANPKGVLEDLPVTKFHCPLATHISVEANTAAEKVRVGQQKQKKR